MGQRSKVLDTDGPTPKFLYAIIKQLDLKIVSSYLPIVEDHYVLIDISVIRLIGTEWPRSLESQMAMQPECDSQDSGLKWTDRLQGPSKEKTQRNLAKEKREKPLPQKAKCLHPPCPQSLRIYYRKRSLWSCQSHLLTST